MMFLRGILLLLLRIRRGVRRRARLLRVLDVTQLGLVMDTSTMRIMEAGADEEDKVDDGQNPDDSPKGRTRRQRTSLATPGLIIGDKRRHAQPRRGRASRPGPGRQPEDEGENVGDQGDEAVEEVRGPDLDGEQAAKDDEGLDGDEYEQAAGAGAVVVVAEAAEDGDGVGGQGEDDQRKDQDGDLDEEDPAGHGRDALFHKAVHGGGVLVVVTMSGERVEVRKLGRSRGEWIIAVGMDNATVEKQNGKQGGSRAAWL
jgi:hypothetical protein